MNKGEIIIGVDPGTSSTGYGIIQAEPCSFQLLAYGCIRTPSSSALPERYKKIFQELSSLLDQYHPQALAVETQFVEKNVTSAIKLGMARGVILLASSLREILSFEYAPCQVKRSVTGNGQASKVQIQGMVRSLLHLKTESLLPEDAADALGIAICHANQSRRSY